MIINTSYIKSKINTIFYGKRLQDKAAHGTIWLGTANGVEQILRFIRNMILTRILAPEAFGVMAIVLAVNNFLESFTEVGIRQALIQNPRGTEETYLNAAWWISASRATVLYSIAYFSAPLIANIYNNPELILILRIAFLSILFRGFMSVRAYVAVKEMHFKKWVFILNGGGILGIILAVVLAFYIKNIWALVIGFTAESAFRFVLSYILAPFFPSFKFDKENLQSIVKYDW
jgi:O-antigen/teichoic acid export membrane protein